MDFYDIFSNSGIFDFYEIAEDAEVSKEIEDSPAVHGGRSLPMGWVY